MTWLYAAAILVVAIIAFYLGRWSVSAPREKMDLDEKEAKPVFRDEKGNLRPFYEEVLPGHCPTERGLPGSGLFGYKQGEMIVLRCFRGLWGSPQSGDASKPPSSTERS